MAGMVAGGEWRQAGISPAGGGGAGHMHVATAATNAVLLSFSCSCRAAHLGRLRGGPGCHRGGERRALGG